MAMFVSRLPVGMPRSELEKIQGGQISQSRERLDQEEESVNWIQVLKEVLKEVAVMVLYLLIHLVFFVVFVILVLKTTVALALKFLSGCRN